MIFSSSFINFKTTGRGKDGPAAMDMILVSNIDGQGINSDSSGMDVIRPFIITE